MTQASIQVVLHFLESSQYDLSSCLTSCSNQGGCSFDALAQQYVCSCNSGFVGESCQTDQSPCARAKCLNNGTCLNVNGDTSYECQCSSEVFYGEFCQYKKNLCENRTCSMNGNCLVNHTESHCKCFTGFSGDECQLEETSLKIAKGVKVTATIICIVCLVAFGCIVVCSDVLDYFEIGNERIDMDKWRGEKLHGKDPSKKTKKKNQKDISKAIKRIKPTSFLEPAAINTLPKI